jgi:arsenate reductase-like glutaredoxin family protein
MNIQIFGRKKCFDTRKAERWCRERGIKYQYIDLDAKPMSRGEFDSVKAALGLEALADEKARGSELLRYLAYASDREEKLFENQGLMKTPIVRNGRKAACGYAPEVWASWAGEARK